MAGATLTTLDSILKDFYLPPVVEQLNNEVLLLQRLEASSESLFGKQAIVPVHKGRSTGIGVAAEGAALPAADAQAYAKASYDLKYLYGRISVTGPSMAKTASEAGAFLQALKSELDGIRSDLKKDLARQVYGSGNGNGLIAQCGTTTAAVVVVLSSAEAIRKGDLYIGMKVDIGTSGSPASIAAGVTITDVSIAGPSITITGSNITTSSSHYVSRSGNGGAEITGLTEIVSTSANTIGGINASSAGNGYWDNLRDTAGGALALDALTKAFNQTRVAGGDTSLMISTFGLERALFNLLQSQVRYLEPMQLKGGFKALEYMGKPFVADVEHPFGRIHLLDERFLKVFSDRDWHFLDEDGTVLKWVSGYDKWEAVLARYINLGATRRNVQMVLSGLTDATGY